MTDALNIDIKQNAIAIAVEQPTIEIQMGSNASERGVWITNIVDNLDGTFTRTYGDWATQITTIDLRWWSWGGSTVTQFHFLTPLSQWDIVHAMTTRPIVTCYDENDRVILPNDIHYLSNSQLQITWLRNQAGIAVLT